MSLINKCEVCGETKLLPVLNLGDHPMCDDLIEVGSIDTCKEYPIEILYCEVCKTAHQKYQVPKVELFPTTYHYRSRFTADVLNGMQDLVSDCVKNFGSLQGKLVLDIGCNDGSLLNFFAKAGGRTIGVEPTGAYVDAVNSGHFTYNDFFSIEVANRIKAEFGFPDVVTFTNVFAHIEDLSSVLSALKIVIGPNTELVVENHYLGSVLNGMQFDTFYHEHPRTYSYSSFVFIAKTLNMNVAAVAFPARYGGNIRVRMSAEKSSSEIDRQDFREIIDSESRFADGFLTMRKFIDSWKLQKLNEINLLNEKWGALPAKAFPGRAAILVKLLGLTDKHISAVYEKAGSLKIGYYVPGTRIPIKSDAELVCVNEPLINLAWHIPKEIHAYMRAHGYDGPILEILDPPVLKKN